MDTTTEDIRRNQVREFNAQQKDIGRNRIFKTAHNAVHRILRHRFMDTSWVCTQNAYDQFKTADHERLMLFSLHFKLKNGFLAYIDGEVDKHDVFTLLVNRKDMKNCTDMVQFINYIFNNEKMGEESAYKTLREEDMAIQLEHLNYIHYAVVGQVAYFVLQFAKHMGEINPRLLFDLINSLQE